MALSLASFLVRLTREALLEASVELIKGRDLTESTVAAFRFDLAFHFGIDKHALDDRREEVKEVIQEAIQQACEKQGHPHDCDDEDIGEERLNASKSALHSVPSTKQQYVVPVSRNVLNWCEIASVFLRSFSCP